MLNCTLHCVKVKRLNAKCRSVAAILDLMHCLKGETLRGGYGRPNGDGEDLLKIVQDHVEK